MGRAAFADVGTRPPSAVKRHEKEGLASGIDLR